MRTDTLNEAGFVEDTIKAFRGRTIHSYHTGAPSLFPLFQPALIADSVSLHAGFDLAQRVPEEATLRISCTFCRSFYLKLACVSLPSPLATCSAVAGFDNVLPSSTNPTRPYCHNTLDEHLDVRCSSSFFLPFATSLKNC